ncbi:TPA: hypothetical protein I9781_002942 [Legionella pneumophila]|uniref:Leucine-rich repeat-containing protein n=1 Tax=Legionella pneumophila TaxID=446 RepID=A0AAN5T9D8_LEGPN|nr:hypothetical protein [Legionella pneumophila]TIH04599.1 hypothetical protein DI137_04495 [Legionella pneumophila]HAT3856308.1 hypothetical protein [Legionella pneumophila]HAT3859129.1 hypothetical protein [Legionella pneumophila]HAT3866004.1 hypothetical protein [Legionella pneumophila]HAT3868807.1 hypothetical protein [Legionella pneumophila]
MITTEILNIKNELIKRINTCSTQSDSRLDLSSLDLDRLSIDGLIETMQKIPKSVTTLNLSDNGLYQLGTEHLAAALTRLPKASPRLI